MIFYIYVRDQHCGGRIPKKTPPMHHPQVGSRDDLQHALLHCRKADVRAPEALFFTVKVTGTL